MALRTRHWLSLSTVLSLLTGVSDTWAQEANSYRAIGTNATQAQVQTQDTDLAPAGAVPEGSGSVAAGRLLYQAQCQHCHGDRGEGGVYEALALSDDARASDAQRGPFALEPARVRVPGNYWPYATTLYDYIRRAMPQLQPGSLSNNEAYAVTAYLLFRNGLLAEDATVDGAVLQKLAMPARRLFEYNAEVQGLLRD